MASLEPFLSRPDIIIGILLSFVVLYLVRPGRRPTHPYPPGPKGLPVIGNVLDIPATFQWLKFAEWTKEYGDVVSLNLFGQRFVILGSAQTINDIMDKRSANYSSRVHLPMIRDLMGYDWSMVFLPYDDVWKKQRQTFQPYFLQRNIDQYNPILLQETRAMLRRMLDEPQGWVGHCRFLFASTIYQIVYGLRLTGPEDPVSLNGERVLKTISDAAVPGAFWVDFIPWLKYLPASIAPFQRTAALWRTYGEEFLNAPWESVQRGMATGKATTCVTSDLISQLEGAREKNGRDNAPEDVRLMKAIAAIAYAGGSDTTVNTLLFFIAAMCLYPDVQRKAQQELDRVVGTGRLPEFKDREELVYIEAVIKESIRWQPVLPFAVPHASSSSDIYNGYYIPEGSIVVGNAWGLLHDPTVYPEPEKFIPERYLTEDGKKLREDIPDPVAAFGFGRRICPGRFLSSSSMFIAVASLLHSFTLSPPEGQKMELKIEPSLITRPADFECMVRPRGEWAVGLVRETENDS